MKLLCTINIRASIIRYRIDPGIHGWLYNQVLTPGKTIMRKRKLSHEHAV